MEGGASLSGLKLAIQQKLGVPLEDMLLSKNPQLVGAGAACRLGAAATTVATDCLAATPASVITCRIWVRSATKGCIPQPHRWVLPSALTDGPD